MLLIAHICCLDILLIPLHIQEQRSEKRRWDNDRKTYYFAHFVVFYCVRSIPIVCLSYRLEFYIGSCDVFVSQPIFLQRCNYYFHCILFCALEMSNFYSWMQTIGQQSSASYVKSLRWCPGITGKHYNAIPKLVSLNFMIKIQNFVLKITKIVKNLI